MIGDGKERLTLTISEEAKRMFIELAAMDKSAHIREGKKGRFYDGQTLERLIRNDYTIRKTFGGN